MAKRTKKHTIPADQIEAAEREILDRSRRIEFYTTEYTVELLVEKLAREEFVIPAYQREFTWDLHRKSRFIESLHIGLPIPFLFFWEMPNGKLEVVDGSQRLRTLHEYVKREMTLASLEELPALGGTRFTDLPPARQRKVLNKSIRGIVLNEHADDQARFDMFERINTGSKVANTAEVRRGALQGPFQDLVEDLAKTPSFARLAPVSAKARGERVPEELVTRFFAYGDGLETYRDSPARFIFDYVKSKNEALDRDPALEAAFRERFYGMLQFVEAAFPTGFAKPENPNSTPRARFEAIAIGADAALRERPQLMTAPYPDVSEWIAGEAFREATTSDAANVRSKLERRINFVRDALLEGGRDE